MALIKAICSSKYILHKVAKVIANLTYNLCMNFIVVLLFF